LGGPVLTSGQFVMPPVVNSGRGVLTVIALATSFALSQGGEAVAATITPSELKPSNARGPVYPIAPRATFNPAPLARLEVPVGTVADASDLKVQRFTLDLVGIRRVHPLVALQGGTRHPVRPVSPDGNGPIFQSHLVHPEAGLYLASACVYDPRMGTFLQVDPSGYADSPNLYAGFANDPVNNRDPTGAVVPCKLPPGGMALFFRGMDGKTLSNYPEGCGQPDPTIGPVSATVTSAGPRDYLRLLNAEKAEDCRDARSGYLGYRKCVRSWGTEDEKRLVQNIDNLTEDVGFTLTLGLSSIVNQASHLERVAAIEARTSEEVLKRALQRQGLEKGPAKLKEKWSQGNFDFEVRVHPADAQHGKTGSIYRVARRQRGQDAFGQGHGWEYVDDAGRWHPESTLKPGKPGHPNPRFDPEAAKRTHLVLPKE
jgi:RHS repeat-associated protein